MPSLPAVSLYTREHRYLSIFRLISRAFLLCLFSLPPCSQRLPPGAPPQPCLTPLPVGACFPVCVEVPSETEAVQGNSMKLRCISCMKREEVEATTVVEWFYRPEGGKDLLVRPPARAGLPVGASVCAGSGSGEG